MSVAPVNNNVTQTVTNAVKTKNPLMVLVSLAALAAAGTMIKDSFDGSRTKRRDKGAAFYQNADYRLMQYGWDQWSGLPMMDRLAHRAKAAVLFGPMNLKIKWQQFKYNVNSLVNDVLLPNLIPIGVAVGSLYTAFGAKTIHGAIGSLLGPLRHMRLPASLTQPLKQMARTGLTQAGNGIVRLAKLAVKKPSNLAVTIGGMIFGGFFLDRFNNVYNKRARADYFQDYLTFKDPSTR